MTDLILSFDTAADADALDALIRAQGWAPARSLGPIVTLLARIAARVLRGNGMVMPLLNRSGAVVGYVAFGPAGNPVGEALRGLREGRARVASPLVLPASRPRARNGDS